MTPSLYIALYYNLLLLIVICIAIEPSKSKDVRQAYCNNQVIRLLLLLLVFIHITFRSTDWQYFGDTAAYAADFQEKILHGLNSIGDKDIGFQYLTYWLSWFKSLKFYWFCLCCLYVLPVLYAFKKQFKSQYAIALVLFICSFSFWGYGVNGLRNGIATSLVVLSFLVPQKEVKRIPIWIVACLMHKSVLLPIGCFLLTRFYKNSKHYLYIWIAALVSTLVLGNSIGTILSSISWFQEDERMSQYLAMSFEDIGANFSSVGFRWDFIIYSLIPIFSGAFFVYKRNFKDLLYTRLLNTYVACNAFWILTTYVPYNNRFAYLSWFLYPIIIIYPLLKENLLPNQGKKIRIIIFVYYLFTYFMWLK